MMPSLVSASSSKSTSILTITYQKENGAALPQMEMRGSETHISILTTGREV